MKTCPTILPSVLLALAVAAAVTLLETPNS